MSQDFLAGLTPFDKFAEAIGKHPKTVKRLNPPVVYIGRTVYVPDDLGREWLLSGCKPLKTNPRRPRKAA